MSPQFFHNEVVLINDLILFPLQFSKYPKCTLHDDLGKLLRAEEFCDVEFKVGKQEKRFLAHICIVGARSKILRAKILDAMAARDKHLDEVMKIIHAPILTFDICISGYGNKTDVLNKKLTLYSEKKKTDVSEVFALVETDSEQE